MKKIILTFAFLILLGATIYGLREAAQRRALQGPAAPQSTSLEDLSNNLNTDAPNELPSVLNLELPFFTQAPHSNWDYPWQEACEEASVLGIANQYKKLELDADSFNEGLLRLVDWEIEYFGAYEHTTVAQTAEMMESQYGLETIIHDNPSFEDIQSILAQGHFIIAPFAGKLLENANFRNGGPNYHMLIIKGYDAEKMQIITNDVGTRNGENFVYSWENIQQALHDWHDEDILLGEPRLIEVLPQT